MLKNLISVKYRGFRIKLVHNAIDDKVHKIVYKTGYIIEDKSGCRLKWYWIYGMGEIIMSDRRFVSICEAKKWIRDNNLYNGIEEAEE